jgi:hypothetical protein
VSADFPGVARRVVEDAVPTCRDAIFLQGACGSNVPIRGTTDFEDTACYGRVLGGEVVRQLDQLGAPDHPVEEARVRTASRVVLLPSRPLPEPGSAEHAFREAETALARAADGERRARQIALRQAGEIWERVRLGDDPFPAEVQAVRLGDVALVGIPGEPFPELGVALKRERQPGHGALCVGYANDYLGYIAPPAAWEDGGYEVSLGMWSIVGPQAFDLLLAAARALIRDLWSAGAG